MQLMESLMDEAGRADKPLRLYVWQHNHGAQHWYKRLGFVPISNVDIYIHMEWQSS